MQISHPFWVRSEILFVSSSHLLPPALLVSKKQSTFSGKPEIPNALKKTYTIVMPPFGKQRTPLTPD